MLTCGSNVWYSYALQIPATTEDSDLEGPETELLVLCDEHGKAAERHVAFEGIHTSRRFLCCAEKVYCDFFSISILWRQALQFIVKFSCTVKLGKWIRSNCLLW